MTKILITEFINQDSLDNLKKNFDIKYDENLYENKLELENIIHNYEGLIVRNKTQLTSDVLTNAKKLKFIGRLGVGLDNIDTETCKNKNIHVQPATGMNADSVAEYVISSSMSLIKKIPIFHNATVKGEWPRTKIKSTEIKQKLLGIIGFGTIGKKVAEYSTKIGLKILAYDPYVREINGKKIDAKLSNLNEIYEKSEIISIHLPLTDETKNMINKSSFSQMKNKPIIINTSRGSIINEVDLIDAYHKNIISGFALDVFEKEPIESEFYNKIKPDMNCILTPHISGVTIESNVRVSDYIVKKITDFFN